MPNYIIAAVASLLSVTGAETTKGITVSELLDKYATAQDKNQSFIVKTESIAESVSSNPKYKDEKRYYRASYELRSDGNREYMLSYSWNNISSPGEVQTKDKASYLSNLWDGKSFLSYARDQSNDLGTVIINRTTKNLEKIVANSGNGIAMGYIHGDYIRVDSILRQADNTSVRDEMEKVGGSNCYVINAKTKRGECTLWIDPEHGFNIAKAEVRRQKGDLSYGRPIPEGTFLSFLENVRFEQVDGVWVPMEWDAKIIANWPGNYLISETHDKRTAITLNPDHEALGSFVPRDIKNGAKVYIKQVPSIHYIWQDGELIPNIDKAVIAEIDKITDKIMAEGKVPPALSAGKDSNTPPSVPDSSLSVPDSSLTVSELLDRYAATQNKLKSFIAKAESKIEYTGKASRTENETYEFRTDGQQVNHRATFWDGVIATREKPSYKSFLWDGKSLIEYKQQTPALGGYRVFIENKDESKKRMIATQYKGAALMGICAGDYERVDSILRKADTISVLDRTERVGDANCYVIDAATKRGRYKLWLDPQHDYNIAKMEVQRKKGDLVRNTGRVETSMSFVLDGVGFKKVGDVWVSMEADMRQEEDNRAGVVKWHHKRIEMVLNPDHNALHSFVADDIPDGTKVSISGLANTEYTWRNGKPVQE
jgi:hypothetical protein